MGARYATGIGRLAARTSPANGWSVAATMRAPEREGELTGLDNVLVPRFDVSDFATGAPRVSEW